MKIQNLTPLRLLIAVLVIMLPTVSWAQRSATFGKDWVESHPFLIGGWASAVLDIDLFRRSRLNTIMSGSGGPIAEAASHSIPWIYLASYSAEEDAGWKRNALNQLAKPNKMGWVWLMDDEPRAIQFAELAAFADWLKDPANGTSDMLVSASLWDSTLAPRPELYWGDASKPDYTYEQYLHDWITIVRPDVISYSAYPYLGNYAKHPDTGVAPDNLEAHFNTLMRVRHAALKHNLPYQVWVRTEKYRRGTGDSELRLQLFAALTTGHKGIYYFQYEHRNSEAYLVNYGDLADPSDDTPNELFPIAAAANAEVARLGESLRFLRSTAVYFIGKGTETHTPSRIPAYESGAQQEQLTGVKITSPVGRFTDGMIGFFEDDNGEEYFMLTNLNFDANDAAKDAVEFEVQFDSSVDSLLRLNRETGKDEILLLMGNRLKVTLPGGTGDLFKYNAGKGFFRGCQSYKKGLARRPAAPPPPPSPPPSPPKPSPPPSQSAGVVSADDFESYTGRTTNLFGQRFDRDPKYATSGWQAFTQSGSNAVDSATIIAAGGGAGAPSGYLDSQGLANVGGGNSHGHAARFPALDSTTTVELTTRINMSKATTPTYIFLGNHYLVGGEEATDDKIWLELYDDHHDRLAGKARIEFAVDGAGAGSTFDLWNWATVGWAEVKIEVDLDENGSPVAIRALHRETPGAGTWKKGAELSPGALAIDVTHFTLQPGFYATLDDLLIVTDGGNNDQ